MRPHRRQPTRFPRPWDSPGKNTGVGCHFFLQCMKVKVKSLSRVRLLATPWTTAHQAPLSMRFSRQEYWSGVPLPSPRRNARQSLLMGKKSLLPASSDVAGFQQICVDQRHCALERQHMVTIGATELLLSIQPGDLQQCS